MKRSYASPETTKFIRRIHVGEQRLVNPDPRRVELVERLVERQTPFAEPPFQHRQRAAVKGGGERIAGRSRRVRARGGELAQEGGGDERRVHRKHHREL